MVRLILIGVGVISTAIAGYVAKRKLFKRRIDQCPPELKIYPPSTRSKTRRSRRAQLNELLDNGQPDAPDLT